MKINLATRITILRIFLVPAVAMAMLYRQHVLAFVIFSLAAITDALDGIVARRWHLRSKLGSILDPLADKVMLMTTFIIMGLEREPYLAIPGWLIVPAIFRDALILLGLGVVHMLGYKIPWGPSFISKANTVAQILVVCSAMLFNAMIELELWPAGQPIFRGLFTGLIWANLITIVGSALDYTVRGVRLLSEQSEAP